MSKSLLNLFMKSRILEEINVWTAFLNTTQSIFNLKVIFVWICAMCYRYNYT